MSSEQLIGGSDSEGYINYLKAGIEERLERFLEGVELVEPLGEAVRYSIFPAGKRIRPLMSAFLTTDLGGNVEEILEVSPSIELIHCSSLVHDDLPAFDDDDYRRGRLSCHKKFGEATGILAGDAMIATAISCINTSKAEPARKFQYSEVLSRGYLDVCSGQQLDISDDRGRHSVADIDRLKTGALFLVSAKFGGIASGVSSSVLQELELLGLYIGLYFQYVDDYKDLFGTDEERGRHGSSDLANDRKTLFTTRGKEEAMKEVLLVRDKIGEQIEVIRSKMTVKDPSFAGMQWVIREIEKPIQEFII